MIPDGKRNFEILRELMVRDRSIRRFDSRVKVTTSQLTEIVELTRYCASGRNLQPLRYRLVTDEAELAKVFPTLSWAGYYKDWAGPSESERPSAYLVQCLDTSLTLNPLCDEGLQLQAITLGATSLGLGCCIIKAFNKERLTEVLGLLDNMDARYVVAIGKPAEKAKIVDMTDSKAIEYYRDADDAQCVPKRHLSELIIR